MSVSVLVIGGGGREHALAWKLAQSPEVHHIFVAPGNAGTANSGKIGNVDVNLKDFESVSAWCVEKQIGLVVVGPEDPLAAGITDVLNKHGIACFGPSAKAAEIEASKEFAKCFMDRHGVPTARWKSFTDASAAQEYINCADFAALVVKASGLAAGKGVIVAKDKAEACQAVQDILHDNKFGAAGNVVVVEELLVGEEISCLAFTDGTSVACFPPAQDHKRILDGDNGPNTGGMGAYCPCPLVSETDLKVIQSQVIQRTVDGMRKDGRPYVGVLYAGMMLTADGPKTLEFNCRFGDPETQVLLPLLKTDLYTVMMACVNSQLNNLALEFTTQQSAVAVVTVSDGYPGSYKKGFEITGLEKVDEKLGQMIFHAGTALKDGKVVTSGGRVLATVAMDTDLASAARKAMIAAETVQFEGSFFRKDIAHKALKHCGVTMSYRDAGVDICAGDALVNSIKPFAAATTRAGCNAELGGFGGVFDMAAAAYNDPLLISGTDGVGTKLKIAQLCGIHETVGIDLVAMCVNDILAHAAEALFFLDYFACGALDVGVASAVVKGVSEGCKLAGCALLGGETAEMPGMYGAGEYDLAGFTVGAVERRHYLPRMSDITSDDVVIGLASSGLHSNGFSLVRKVVDRSRLTYASQCPFDKNKTLGQALLAPTRIYSKTILPALRCGKIKAFAHITGGGLPGNVCRVLPDHLAVRLDATSWRMHPMFGWIAAKGNVSLSEMAKTFNCGIGGVVITSYADHQDVLNMLHLAGEEASMIGKVITRIEGRDQVEILNLASALDGAWPALVNSDVDHVMEQAANRKKKVGVLISGTGTNLQALLDYTSNPANESCAQIALVISNKPGVLGLDRAAKAGVPTKVIAHAAYKSRESFEEAVDEALNDSGVEIVCLAGFMRILTGGFVKKWQGKMLNVHPSLLPSFKGAHAHRLVLESGVRLTGCTVHFVAEEVDAGAILVQECMPILPGDTEDTLADRLKPIEHKAFPKALELVASGQAVLGPDGRIIWAA